jgi:hypothetical protein
MNKLTIVTRLRFAAVATPALLLIVALVLAGALHDFGGAPRDIYDNQYAASRAAREMENSLYKMDWGRSQQDGPQIVLDQQRKFIDEIETARGHITTREQAEKIAKIATDARPLFEAMRAAQPGDDSTEPRLRDLEGQVADLTSADDSALVAFADSAQSQARTMIAVTLVGAVVVPWLCFIVIARLTGGLHRELKEIRRRIEALSGRDAPAADDLPAVDAAVARLGFPQPNPMLAE